MDQLKYFFATDDTILKEISFKQVFKVWFRLFFSYQLINNRIKDKFHSIQKQEFLFFLSNNNTSFFLQIKTIEINSPNVSLIISKKKERILDDWTIFPIFSFSILLSRKTINKIQKLGAIDSTSWHKSSILPFKRSLINPQQRLIDLPFYFLRRSNDTRSIETTIFTYVACKYTRVPDLSATVSPNWWKEEIYPGTEGFLRGTFNYRTRERYLRAFYLDVRPRKSGRRHFNIVPSPARKSISREIRVLLAFNSCSNPKGGGGFEEEGRRGRKKKRTVQFVSSTLRFENGDVRGSCSTILRSRFLRFIVNDCPASRRCLLIHRRCLWTGFCITTL